MKVMRVLAAISGVVIRVGITILIVLLIYRGTQICYDYGYRIYNEPTMAEEPGTTISVTITPDMKALEIGELLQSKGLIRDSKLFVMQYYLSEHYNDAKKVKSGTFEFSTAMTVEEMMEVIAQSAKAEKITEK